MSDFKKYLLSAGILAAASLLSWAVFCLVENDLGFFFVGLVLSAFSFLTALALIPLTKKINAAADRMKVFFRILFFLGLVVTAAALSYTFLLLLIRILDDAAPASFGEALSWALWGILASMAFFVLLITPILHDLLFRLVRLIARKKRK